MKLIKKIAKDKLTVVCGVIFLFVMIFVLSTGFKGELPKHDFKVNAEEVNSVIDFLTKQHEGAKNLMINNFIYLGKNHHD